MKRLAYRIKSLLLTLFGDLKVFPWPMFVVYSPTTFRVKGRETREIMAKLQPGDVLMRSYVNYVDGYFIPSGKSGCTHSGVYVGDGKVVHAMAEGLLEDDVIDFCRCDRVVVMRPRKAAKRAVATARRSVRRGVEYDFDFRGGNARLYCHEFTASCFPTLDVGRISPRLLWLVPMRKVYLADSFFLSKSFRVVHRSLE